MRKSDCLKSISCFKISAKYKGITMKSDFSARPSALGYLYQTQYSLLLLLNNDSDAELALENLDDASFEDKGTPKELLQFKFHVKEITTLAEYSPELWKTLRVWATLVKENKVSPNSVVFSLLTTAEVKVGSVLELLCPHRQDKRETVCKALLHIAETSKNKDLKPAFEAFRGLSQENRQEMINSISLLDSSMDFGDIVRSIKKLLSVSVRYEHVDLVYERLEGWWLDRVVKHLLGYQPGTITRLETTQKIADIAEEYKADSLPIEFLDAVPGNAYDPANDQRMFVHQLRAIGVVPRRIELAVLDYYRAATQRSKWIREDLLVDEELEKYERRLEEEWERYSLACYEKVQGKDDDAALKECGREIYNKIETGFDIRIRPRVTAPYVMRGSYHMLANAQQPRVYWHPKFLEKISEILSKIPELK